jgi:hypothetical protein
MIVAGVPYDVIVEHCRTKWGLSSPRSADALIGKAREKLAKAGEKDGPTALGKAAARYELILAKQLSSGDLRGACTTVGKIVDLYGLSEPTKAEITLANVPLPELEAELARLEAKIADNAAHDG